MRRVLLWVCLDTHFREMIRIARLLRSRPGFEPVILFVCRYPLLDSDVELCRREGIAMDGRGLAGGARSVSDPPATAEESPPGTGPGPTVPSRWRVGRGGYDLLRWIYRSLGGRRFVGRILDWDFVLAYRHYRRLLREARETVARLEPALLVLPEDNVEYATAPLIKAAHEKAVASVVVPYTLADALEPAEAYWDNGSHRLRLPLNRLMGALHPRWKYRHRGRDLLRLPAGHVWAQEKLGLAPALPWILNSGFADAVAVESDAVRDYYLRAGLEPDRLQVTGSLRQDEVWAGLPGAREERGRRLRDLGLPEDRPVFLCALPPNQYPERRPECEFRRYEDIVRYWFASLEGLEGSSVLVNLHPRIPYDSMRHLETERVRIVTGDVARLIPLCDCFVASVSATICLAIACGKPVVNYDVYRFRYRDFTDVKGVLTMETGEDFLHTLHRLAEDPRYYREIEAAQKEAQDYWGRPDGQAGERLIRLFDGLVSGRG